MMIGEKSKTVAFLPPPGRQGKKWSRRRDRRKARKHPKKAETTPEPITSPPGSAPQGLWLVVHAEHLGPVLPIPGPAPRRPTPSRDAGVALLTRRSLGGLARALEVGRSDRGLSELGR